MQTIVTKYKLYAVNVTHPLGCCGMKKNGATPFQGSEILLADELPGLAARAGMQPRFVTAVLQA